MSGSPAAAAPPAPRAPSVAGLAFQFERDTFAFANELVWQYRLDPATRQTTIVKSEPPPTYWHRCFVMVRAARQFLYHARFDATRPALPAAAYAALTRAVVSRGPRQPSAPADRVEIPGYAGLRAFSRAQEAVVKAECGAAWESYFLRSHWRMVFPVWRAHQARMARQLTRALRTRVAPIVHVFRFPRITINHGLILFGVAEAAPGLRFAAYDPNIPERPVPLLYDAAGRTFHFPPTHYWAGGRVAVVEVVHNWFY